MFSIVTILDAIPLRLNRELCLEPHNENEKAEVAQPVIVWLGRDKWFSSMS